MNAHRWNLAGLLVLLTAIAIDQPVVAKIFRLRRTRTAAMAETTAVKAIVDLDAVTCAEGSTACCDSNETNRSDACCNLQFVSAEVFVPETILGDTDGNGAICAVEAVSVLNDEVIKKELFGLPISQQKDYLMLVFR